MICSRWRLSLAIALLSLAFASLSNAALVSVDFNTSTAKGPSATTVSPLATGNPTGTFGGMGASESWNTLNLGPNSSVQSAPVATGFLRQAGGLTTTALFTVTSGAYTAIAYDNTQPLYGDEMVLTPSQSVNWQITGLQAGTQYDLLLLGNFSGSNSTSVAGFTVNGDGPNSGTKSGPTNTHVTYSGVTATADPSGGIITGTAFSQGTNGEWIGFQIRGAFATPEPASVGLLGAGALGLLARRRRTV